MKNEKRKGEMMMKKKIVLSTEKELRIYMLPLRQRIIREMEVEGKPMTTKQLADKLKITPSSARHHLSKLQELGIVEFDHSEFVNGIKANYMKLTDVVVSIGQELNDGLQNERSVYSQNVVAQVYEGYESTLKECQREKKEFSGAFLSGVIHLTKREVQELHSMLLDMLREKRTQKEDTEAYEVAFVGYRVEK